MLKQFLNPEKDLKISNTHVLATPEVDSCWHQKVEQLSNHLKSPETTKATTPTANPFFDQTQSHCAATSSPTLE